MHKLFAQTTVGENSQLRNDGHLARLALPMCLMGANYDSKLPRDARAKLLAIFEARRKRFPLQQRQNPNQHGGPIRSQWNVCFG